MKKQEETGILMINLQGGNKMEEYKILKLTNYELEELKTLLIDKRVEFLIAKSNYEKNKLEGKTHDTIKYEKLHRQNKQCEKLLNIIEYLER